MRYKANSLLKKERSKPIQSTYVLGKIPFSPNDRYVEVTTTDRLDLIAHKYYGNRDFWWIIADANGIGKGTLNIDDGKILRLPADPQGITTSNKNNISGY